jgi:hypothetical protein
MRTLVSGPFPWLIGGFALLVVAGYFWFAGSAVVVDETSGVQSAVVTNNDGVEQKLYSLGGGYFYAIPSVEGVIEVRCSNGARMQMGYVTGHLHTKVKVVGKSPCERIVEDV